MKPKPHFLPKRQTVIYGFTEQMLRDTGSRPAAGRASRAGVGSRLRARR